MSPDRGRDRTDEEDSDGDTLDALAARRGLDRDVYAPAEDSALLAAAALDHLSAATDRDRILEVGTGSGWVAARVAAETSASVVASDVNPHACRRARERALASPRGFEVVRGDLVEPFADRTFDAVLFNPPYLPTDPDNEWDDWMEAALSGGESGRAIVEPFVDAVGRVLAPAGDVLLLVSSLAGFDDVIARAERAGFAAETIRQESYPFETLSVVRLSRPAVK